MTTPSEPLAQGHTYDVTKSLRDTPAKIIASSTLRLRLCKIVLNANSLLLTLAGSSLSSREVTYRLAVVTASERQSPSSSTPDEVQRPLAERNSVKIGNGPIHTGDGQKAGSTITNLATPMHMPPKTMPFPN